MNNKKDKVLMKNNMFVTARYNLGLIENRIFIIILYKLQKNNNGSITCDITHDEFKALIGNKNQHTLIEIRKILQGMLNSKVYFVQQKYNKKGNIWGEYNLINGFEYDDEIQSFKIECSQRVYDLLRSYLDSGYTPINLKVYVSLNNPNSQRLYDLLRLWSNSKNIISYEVDEIRELLMLEDKYEKYSDLKKRVITPAVKELNNTNMFDISFEEKKKGRKINTIDFTVKDLDKRVYFQEKFDIFDEKRCENNKNDKVFYIPDKSAFTTGTLRAFKSDFRGHDFNDRYLEMAFNDAINITLEKDDVEKVYMKSYKYFKGSLKNKIDYYIDKQMEDEEHQKQLDQYWPK